MNLFGVMETSGSAMLAERMRAEVVAANMANAETTRTEDGGPYRRQQVVFAADGSDPRVMRAKLEGEIPMRRIGSVDDVAAMVALLVSPRGRYTTGAAIAVDGGLLRGVR